MSAETVTQTHPDDIGTIEVYKGVEYVRVARETPAIYVACLSAYNNGCLHGEWINFEDIGNDYDELMERINAMLARSPYPGGEWAVHDHMCWHGIDVGEWPDLQELCDIAEAFQTSDYPAELIGEVHANMGYADVADTIRWMEDNYLGQYESLADYCEQLHRDCYGDIPRHLEYYIDWESMGRDSELNGDIQAYTLSPCEVHIFSNY